jgi:hypothetical protein
VPFSEFQVNSIPGPAQSGIAESTRDMAIHKPSIMIQAVHLGPPLNPLTRTTGPRAAAQSRRRAGPGPVRVNLKLGIMMVTVTVAAAGYGDIMITGASTIALATLPSPALPVAECAGIFDSATARAT